MWDNHDVTVKVSCSELVGRSAELAMLEDTLSSSSPSALTVLLSGEPGIGKSRLVSEISSRAAGRGALAAVGGASPIAGPDLPYGPVVSALRSLARRVPDGAEVMEPALAALGFPSVQGAAEGAERRMPEAGMLARTWLFETLLECLVKLADRAQTVITLEDLHWADHGTLGVVDFLTRNLGDCPVVLLCTCRSDELAGDGVLRAFAAELGRCDNVRRLELGGLDRAALARLAADVLGHEATRSQLDTVERLAGGNPFFAEELLATSVGANVPSGLRDVVMGRVEQLDPAVRHALDAVSVFGGAAEHRLLAEVVDLEGVELDGALREALSRQLVVTDGTGYRFRHELLRETLYESLLPGERARLHGRVARVLDADPSGDAFITAELSRHWWNAGDWRPALTTSLASADAAMAVYAFDDALTQFERALAALDSLEAAGTAPELDRIDILSRAADAAYWGGVGERAVTFSKAAVDLTDPEADPVAAGRCWTRLGRSYWAVGDPPGSFHALDRAAQLLPDQPSVELARVQAEQARGLMLMSRFEDAVERCHVALATARSAGAHLEEGHATCTLGIALTLWGEPDKGLALLRSSLELAEKIGDPELLNRAYGNLSAGLVEWGDLEEAAALTLDMVAAGEQLGGIRLNGAAFNSAEALLMLGRWDEAERVARDFGGTPSGNCSVTPFSLQLTLDVLRGDLQRARPLLELLDERTRSLGDVQFRGMFHVLDAQVALQEGRYADASEAVNLGLALTAGTDDQSLSIELCALGIRAVVDGAVSARAAGRRVDTAKARLLAAELVDKAGDIADGPRRQALPALPRTMAWLAQCRAEAARLAEPSPKQWDTATTAWSDLSEALPVAYCRWRQAEALLAGRSERARAAELVTEAWKSAASIGARPLVRDIEQTARRAGIELAIDEATSTPPSSVGSDLGLTSREVEVLAQLATGRSDAQIAEALFISKKTASVHVSNILRKLGVSSRFEAGEIGQQAGLG